jgi:hypothetical protein
MRARYVPNEAGLRAMLATPAMVTAMQRKGDRIVNYAKLTGPYVTGAYYRGWRVFSGVRKGKAWCRVANIVDHAYFLEYGTKHMRRQRILGRSVIAARR